MSATRQLHDLGQSLWLDNITRSILDDGTLARHIAEWSVTGLTSNPTIFDHAIKTGDAYDPAIRRESAAGKSGEALFFDLAIEDLRRAADLVRPIHDRTDGVDGWVSPEVTKDPTAPDTLCVEALAAQLQHEGAVSFDASWKDLLGCPAAKRAALLQPDHVTTRGS